MELSSTEILSAYKWGGLNICQDRNVRKDAKKSQLVALIFQNYHPRRDVRKVQILQWLLRPQRRENSLLFWLETKAGRQAVDWSNQK